MYSEFLFNISEDDHITNFVILIFSMKNSYDVLLFDCCRDVELRDFRFLQLSQDDSSEIFDFQSTDCIYSS
jgi:polygalacturonase